MKFVKVKDATKLGIMDIQVNCHTMYAASYDGQVITRLFKTEEEAIESAASIAKSMEPIIGLLGFYKEKGIALNDRVVFWQVIQFGKERSLVIGTESGGIEEVLMFEEDVFLLDDKMELYGKRVHHLLAMVSDKVKQSEVERHA